MAPSEHHPFRSPRLKVAYHARYQERAQSWPVPSEIRMVDTPTGETLVRSSGDPADPPLVLLPGSRDTSLMWIPYIASLSERHRVFALDSIYDIGLSVPHRKLTNRQDLVNWLDEVLAVLVPEGEFRLLGMSYGGWLASQYALRFPRRVQKLVLIAPAATVLPVALPFLLHAVFLLLPGRFAVKKFLYWLLEDSIRSGEAGKAIVDRAIDDWVFAQRAFAPLPLINATVLKDEEWKAFQVPTLFIDGEHEKVYSAQKAVHRLSQVAPQVRTEIIPHAGHDLLLVQHERITQTLQEFLRES